MSQPLLEETTLKLKDIVRRLNNECRNCDEEIFCLGCKYYVMKIDINRLLKKIQKPMVVIE